MQSVFGHFPASEFFNTHACSQQLLFAVLGEEVEHVVTPDSAAQVREAVPVARGSSIWRINLHLGSFACVLHCR
jgi:hypothetical protein